MWRVRATPRNASLQGQTAAPRGEIPLERNRETMNITGTVGAILNHKGHEVHSIPPDATVFEAIRLMADNNIGALLVTSDEKLVGVISERDYTRKVALK